MIPKRLLKVPQKKRKKTKIQPGQKVGGEGGRHSGPKSLILAPQDIPDISGYQLGFGCQCVKAYNNENHVINQKILQIRFVSDLDIFTIVRTPGIVKCNNPLKLNPFGLV